ncbi:MAG: hypothetical protein CM1200mP29_07560 [Verrucomicrobiota bacterium]|nr:MAG: hypothetical protein CM1200mP29_07560 [Verrucomicrobiota bacterium]
MRICLCDEWFPGAHLAAIKLGGSGDLTDSKSVIGPPIVEHLTPRRPLSNGRIWYLSGTTDSLRARHQKRQAAGRGRTADGQRCLASPGSAGGRVYIAGRKALFPCSRTAPSGGAGNQQLDEKFDCSPGLVGNQIFLRARKTPTASPPNKPGYRLSHRPVITGRFFF